MTRSRALRRLAMLLASVLLTAGAAALASLPQPDQDATIIHALNRLAYGPRPGEVEKVRKLGLEHWIDLQLHPDRISDKALGSRLAPLATVGLSTPDLMREYDLPRQAKQEIARRKAQLGANASEDDLEQLRRESARMYAPDLKGSPHQVIENLQEAKLLRAVYSERQLDEVLVDFWMNHFNVYAQKGPDKFLIGEYERTTIRPHAWGRFEDLLRATAESPAMLFYLDNWLSTGPDAPANAPRRGSRRRQDAGLARFPMAGRRAGGPAPDAGAAPRGQRGLNENYAREIMELHTLGVDGGYTQKDVTEVARCFTGWTITGLRDEHRDPEFAFVQALHEPGDKVVLGHTIRSGGQSEGEDVIHILATHPATARFIAAKLARRFVSDTPPPALVERAAATFQRTDGDIRSVIETIVKSPEFLDADPRDAKIKTPLEFVASAARASGATIVDASEAVRRLSDMGMPLYMQQPPTGYRDTSDAWVSTGGLLARLDLALDLAAGRLEGVEFHADKLAPRHASQAATVDSLAARLLPAGLSSATRASLEAPATADLDAERLAGLILGSPDFQRK